MEIVDLKLTPDWRDPLLWRNAAEQPAEQGVPMKIRASGADNNGPAEDSYYAEVINMADDPAHAAFPGHDLNHK